MYYIQNNFIVFTCDFDGIPTREILDLLKIHNCVSFTGSYNKSIDWLPDNIKEIHFETCLHGKKCSIKDMGYPSGFNQPINNLPKSLKYLFLDCPSFDQSLDNLPLTLNDLIIDSYELSKSLDMLPESLTSLEIVSHTYNQPLLNLPKSLEHLELKSTKYKYDDINKIIENLPNLKMIVLNNSLKESLENISYNHKVRFY